MFKELEDAITSSLEGDMQKNALDFVAYLKASGMTPNEEHSSAFMYSGKWVCILCIIPIDGKPNWVIFDNPLCGRDVDISVEEDLKEFAWKHVNICTSCGGSCGCGSQPGVRKTIFGKEFENVCTSEVAFWNPDAEALKKVMRLIEIWKNHIDGTSAN